MILQCLPVQGVFETNAYFYVDESSKHGFLIDPGAEPEKLASYVQTQGWTIEKILLTHGHFDHTGAVEALSNRWKIPYLIHQNGKVYLEKPDYNLSRFCGADLVLTHATYIDDGAEIALTANPSVTLTWLHTPGHTTDSSVLYDTENHVAFVGDTIFKGSIGRTDFPGGNERQLAQSIRQILSLPPQTMLYSGHSLPTDVQTERTRYGF